MMKKTYLLICFGLVLFGIFLLVQSVSATVTWSTISDGYGGTASLCTVTGYHTWDDVYNADVGGTGHENITKIGNKLFYSAKDVYFVVGDGSTVSNLNITGYTIVTRTPVGVFSMGFWFRDIFNVKNNAVLRLTKSSITLDHGYNLGFTYPVHVLSGGRLVLNQSRLDEQTASVYSVYCDSTTTSYVDLISGSGILNGYIESGNVTAVDSSFVNTGDYACRLSTVYFDNVFITGVANSFYQNNVRFANDVKVTSSTYAAGLVYGNIVVKNSNFIGCTYLALLMYHGHALELRDCSSNTWVPNSGNYMSYINRTYSFDLLTEQNATVIVKNNYGYEEYNGTVASGRLPTLILKNFSYYNGGYTYYSYNLTITKDGYRTYYKNFDIVDSVNWTIALVENVAPDVDITENLINCVGTYEYTWNPLLYKFFMWLNYTGTGGGAPFLMHNPNPGNGTLGYNYLQQNKNGIITQVDIIFNNFTELNEDNLGTGTIIEAYDKVSDNWGTIIENRCGQSFTIGTTGYNGSSYLTHISLNLSREDIGDEEVTGKMMISIYKSNNTGGFDNPLTNCLSTGMRDIRDISINGGWITFNMTGTILYNSVKYGMFFRFIDNNCFIECRIDTNNDGIPPLYNGGSRLFYHPSVGWSESAFIDYQFNITGWSLGGNISWDNIVNLTFSSNSSGNWQSYCNKYAIQNESVSCLNTNMTSPNTQYWWRVVANSNGTVLGNETWMFTTGIGNQIIPINIDSDLGRTSIPLGLSFGLLGGIIGILISNKRKKQI